jgi:hypothetical protein
MFEKLKREIMKLVTVTNEKFLGKAIVLSENFISVYGSDAHICLFGNVTNLPPVRKEIIFHRLEEDVPHAFNERFYYFKIAAVHYGIENLENEFIYLDSAFNIYSRGYEIEDILNKESRFFVQYPPIEELKNKYWTTVECIKRCNGIESNETSQYWAAIQAYTVTEENKKFIKYQFNLMKDPFVAGPSNYNSCPDGPNMPCRAHRNDQSVLTMAINKFNYSEPYNEDITSKYGDDKTINVFDPGNNIRWNLAFRGRC